MARGLSPAAHESILKAFIRLMEDHAIDDISTEAIAEAAGASKSTLYNHWADKDALLIDVVNRLVASQPIADSGDFRTDVIELLRSIFVPQKRNPHGRAWPAIFSYCFTHQELCRTLHQALLANASKHTLIGIIRAATEDGELRKDLDPEFALDLLAGPLMHHRYLHGSVPPELPEQVVALVWPTLKRLPTH